MKNSTFKNKVIIFFKRKSVIIILILIVIVTLAFIYFSKGATVVLEVASSSISNVIEKVSVTGKVVPDRKTDLSFEKGGTVSSRNFKVGDKVKTGDVIIALDSSDAKSSLSGAQASLEAEKAHLTELEKGLRPEEISVEYSKLKSAQTALNDSKVGLINALHDSNNKTITSVSNYFDTFFINPSTVVPRINIRTDSYNQANTINNSRILVSDKLKLWKIDLDAIDTLDSESDLQKYINNAHEYLNTVKTMVGQLSVIVSSENTGNTGLSQSVIDTFNLNLNSGSSVLNTTINSLASAESIYNDANSALLLAQDQFNLKKSGSSDEALQVQQAKVSQAEANVSLYKSELSKKSIISPFQGTVTKIVPEIGEFVSPGQIVVSVISDNLFKVEVNVPEADIAKVAVGNKANITLDSYGQYVIFPATVVSIDPAETIIEGVSTYKVTLSFDNLDERIRSGMTSNIDILTHEIDNVLTVPTRAVIDDNGKKTVRVVNADGKTFVSVPVVVGLKGSDGVSEIVSGIIEGQKVVTYIK